MPPKNAKLSAARSAKNDEFYTRLEDIEREMAYYRDHFRDKVVFLNCDDPEESNFWRYFELNFDFLGLRKLISTHYDAEKPTYKLEIIRGEDRNGDGKIDGRDLVKTPLEGNGDFRSPEAVALLQESDIVVTNPPFSLFREYITQLMEFEKDFIILGNMNAITYKETWGFIQGERLWLGATGFNTGMYFRVPDDFVYSDTYKFDREMDGNRVSRVPGISWFTNLDHRRRHEEIILFREYDPAAYPTYDNYDAIEVSKVADIPVDYTLERVVSDAELAELRSRGFVVTELDRPTDRPDSLSVRIENPCIGVPITFLGKHNPEQFEIVGYARGEHVPKWARKTYEKGHSQPYVGGTAKYDRILIRGIAREK